MRELGVEGPGRKEILADRDGLLRTVEYGTYEGTDGRSQETQADRQSGEHIVERSVGRFRRIQQTDYRAHAGGCRRSCIADGRVVGIEEFPNSVDVVSDIEVLDAKVLTLKGWPVRWRTGRACDANAVIVAELDATKKALGEGLSR